jgi:hypothetical protein
MDFSRQIPPQTQRDEAIRSATFGASGLIHHHAWLGVIYFLKGGWAHGGLGAAHAACFTMSFVRMIGMANFVPEQVDRNPTSSSKRTATDFSITSVHPA